MVWVLKQVADYKLSYDDLNFLYDNRASKAAATTEAQKRIEELTQQVETFRAKG